MIQIHKTKILLLISVLNTSTDFSFKGHELPYRNQGYIDFLDPNLLGWKSQLQKME